MIRFERLEYGKRCAWPGGPVLLGAEHQIVAQSNRFPAGLVNACHPGELGLGADSESGCVLRPFRGKTIAYQLATRPEDDGQRYYQLGRYLVADTPTVDPWAVCRALAEEPLDGLGPDFAWINAVSLADEFPPALSISDEEVVNQALIRIMSGIAVVITSPISQVRFFTWASYLWRGLPPALRPKFSLGYKISWPLTTELNFATAHKAPNSVSVWYAGTWRDVYQGSFLLPGRVYAAQLGDADVAWYTMLEQAVVDTPIEESPFLQFGMVALDFARLKKIQQWLEGEEIPSRALCLSTEKYCTSTFAEEVFACALQALDNPWHLRAEAIVWAALHGARRVQHEATLRYWTTDSQRAQGILAFSRHRINGIVLLTHLNEDGQPLPSPIAAALERQLDDSIQDGFLSLEHLRLLSNGPVPEDYLNWLRQRAVVIRSAMETWPATARSAGLRHLNSQLQMSRGCEPKEGEVDNGRKMKG